MRIVEFKNFLVELNVFLLELKSSLPAGFQLPSAGSVDPCFVGQYSVDEVVHLHVGVGFQL